MRVRVRVQLLEVVEMGGGEIVRVVRPSRWMGRRRGWMAGMMRLSRRRVRAFRAFAFLSFSQSAFTICPIQLPRCGSLRETLRFSDFRRVLWPFLDGFSFPFLFSKTCFRGGTPFIRDLSQPWRCSSPFILFLIIWITTNRNTPDDAHF